MLGHIPVPDLARADLHHHEDIKHAERRRERDKEIACQNGAPMVANERAPTGATLCAPAVHDPSACSAPPSAATREYPASRGARTRSALRGGDGEKRDR